jgi:predicted transcriptional regulator
MKNRCRNEIIASILEVIIRGGSTTRTKVTYGSFIYHMQLNEYLAFLLKNDLISYQTQQKKTKQTPPSFTITEKGTHFLKIHNQINEGCRGKLSDAFFSKFSQ